MFQSVFSSNHKFQSAFTLVELIMVIVILGILAAFALPRFSNLGSQSKAAALQGVASAMRGGVAVVKAAAATDGQATGTGSIVLNGTALPLFNGYPAVNGSDSFVSINNQVHAWIDIDSVDRDTASGDPDAATFFTDKASADNQIFIFFSEDFASKSVSFGCQVRYQNPTSGTGPEVRVLSNEC